MPILKSESSQPGRVQAVHRTDPIHDRHHKLQALIAHLIDLGNPTDLVTEFLSCVPSNDALDTLFERHLSEWPEEMQAKWRAVRDILPESSQVPFQANRLLLLYSIVLSTCSLQRAAELPMTIQQEFLEQVKWDSFDVAAIVAGCQMKTPSTIPESTTDDDAAEFLNRRYRMSWERSPQRFLLAGIADAKYLNLLSTAIEEQLPRDLRNYVDERVNEMRTLAAKEPHAEPVTRSRPHLSRPWPDGPRPGVAVEDWASRWSQACVSSDKDLSDACGELAPQDLFDRWRQAIHLVAHKGHDPFPGIVQCQDLLRELVVRTLVIGQRHPGWEWFSVFTDAAPYYLRPRIAGNLLAAEAAKGFVASLWGTTAVYLTPLAVWVRRTWVLRWLDWAGGSVDKTEARQKRVAEAATWLRNQWLTTPGGHDEIDEARRYWAELKRQARTGCEPIPIALPDSMPKTAEQLAGLALDLILLVRGPAAALKAVQLVLRDLQVASVPPSLATSYSPIPQATDERIASDWSMIPDLGMYVINQARALGDAAGWHLAQGFADDLVDRLKPRKAGVPLGDLAESNSTGGVHPTMVEPSDLWRAGYIRALGELALDDTRKVSRVLDHVQREDLNPAVAASAADARTLIAERSTKRRALSPWRLMIHAWWRLRWTHRLWLQVNVDPNAAQSVRLLEVRSAERT